MGKRKKMNTIKKLMDDACKRNDLIACARNIKNDMRDLSREMWHNIIMAWRETFEFDELAKTINPLTNELTIWGEMLFCITFVAVAVDLKKTEIILGSK